MIDSCRFARPSTGTVVCCPVAWKYHPPTLMPSSRRSPNRRRWHDDLNKSGRDVVDEAGDKPFPRQCGNRPERSNVDSNRRAGIGDRFCLEFPFLVGTSAMEYLTRWQMLRAGDRLVNSLDSVSAIALSLGYESESAFGFAFKRVMGCSPRQYCRARTSALPVQVY
jgi:Helix-turn-helix domain